MERLRSFDQEAYGDQVRKQQGCIYDKYGCDHGKEHSNLLRLWICSERNV